MRNKHPLVAVFGDWDADGIISSAVIVSSQRYGGVYPVNGEALVEYDPAGPLHLSRVLAEGGCRDVLVILDIPIIDRILGSLKIYRSRCSPSRIIYIDHHISSHERLEDLYGLVDEPLIGYVPTSRIALDRAVSAGFRPGERLRSFVEAVHLMDQGLRISSSMASLYRVVSGISKALAVKRDPLLWRRAVEWISSPVLLPGIPSGESMAEIAVLAGEAEKRVREEANILAISAQRLGIFRYIDARKRWRGRGASALASMLYRKLRNPVILCVASGNEGYVLLVIKFPGRAYRVMRILRESGAAVDIGGHSSLGIARVLESRLEEALELLRRIPYNPQGSS